LNAFNLKTSAGILLAFIVVSLLPGYVLLRLINAFHLISYLEAFILSYALSLAISGILPILFMPLMTQGNRLGFLGLMVFLSTLPILKDLVTKDKIPTQKVRLKISFTRLVAFFIIVAFFSIVIIYLYPQSSLIPGSDIVRNFSSARLWGLSPELFSSGYPFFHIYQSAIYSVSIPSLEVYQTFLAFTSIGVLLSFYIMAKKYLDEIDTRLPIVAAVFWTMFSGFGWIYFLVGKLEQPNIVQMNLLSMVYDATYADIGYGLSTNLWLYGFIAMTASFTIFFALLYLLKCKDFAKSSLMLLISVLAMALYFIHASELVMFVLLLVVLELLGQRNNLCLREAIYSTLFGLVGVITISYLMFSSFFYATKYVQSYLIALIGLAYVLHLLKWKGLSSEKRSRIIKTASYALMIFFIAGLLSWFPSSANFLMKSVGDTFLVPWFFQPVRLGIIGLLGLLGMLVVAKRLQENAVAIFPILFFTALIAGRVVSFINVNFFHTGFWEWRFLFFSFAATSITSTLLLKNMKLEKIVPSKPLGRICLNSFLIGLLVLSGISSTFLTIEKRVFSTDEKYLLDEDELNALSFLSSTFLNCEPSPLITVTHRSGSALEFVPSPWVEKRIFPLFWSPKYLEIPLTFIYNMRFAPLYIYLHPRDIDAITNTEFQKGYLSNYFLQFATEVYSDSEIKIYKVPNGVPPLHNGESVLVVSPKEASRNDLLASYILSLGGYNYTTMLDSDPEIFERDILLFPSDSITTADISRLEISNRSRIFVFNLEGYGSLSRLFFESQENEVSIDVKSGEGIFVHSLTNHTFGLTSIIERLFAGGVEFIIYNTAQKIDYISIVDDNQEAYWTSTGGVGTGMISAPSLASSPSIKMEGEDGLKIIINEGDYRDWFVQHNYLTNQNWSSKDFMTFWWYGSNSGQTIGILAAVDLKNYFQYIFVDDFTGWQRLVIPLRRFVSHGEPNWASIQKLRIRSFNGGVAGTWYLDSIGLEDGNDASIELTAHEAAGEPSELSFFDGLTHIPISLPQNSSTIKIPANTIYFSDGSRADEIFGEEYFGEARLEKIGDTYNLTLSLRLPPESEKSSQLRFRADYETEKMNARHIVISEAEIPLPLEIELTPLIRNEETNILGWYTDADGSEEAPLVATQSFGDQVEVFYLNIYPMVKTAFSGGSASKDFFQIVGSLLDVLEFHKYDKALTSWVIEDDNPVFAFKEGTLKGNISIYAESLIPSQELRLSEIYVSIDDTQVLLKDPVSLTVKNTGGKITLSSEDVKISSGRGFYTFINADNPKISITGDDILLSALASNGTCIDVEGSATAELSMKGNFLTYLRNPHIHNIGNSSFRDVYAFHSYLGQLRTMGEDLLIQGEVRFGLPLSDRYNVASDFTWDGIATREPPVLAWDELKSLRESIPYFIMAIAIFSVAWMATQKSYRIRVRFRRWEQSK